jgi:glucan 1,3-beta-glucosidase
MFVASKQHSTSILSHTNNSTLNHDMTFYKKQGTFNRYTANYTDINYANIAHALNVVTTVVKQYRDHPAVLGLEPVNEPWQYTPIDLLKQFYWDGYLITKRYAPNWKYVMHDSFRLDTDIWGGFMSGCPDRALDTHIYQAWNFPGSRETFYDNACQQKHAIAAMEDAFGPVIVGEWSLATDNCAMWLNGFNDNLSGYPMLPCKYVPCPDPYMGAAQPGTPVDPGKPIQGPFGTGMSGPSWGMCPVDRDWISETTNANANNGKSFMHAPPKAPPGLDDTDTVMRNLAQKKINTFSGQFMLTEMICFNSISHGL